MDSVMELVPMLVALGVVAFAQLRVKPRSSTAALGMTMGGGVKVAYLLATRFVPVPFLGMLGPVFHVVSVGGVVFGLLRFADELNPRREGQLPPTLASMMVASPNLPLRGVLGFFGVAAVGTSLVGTPPLLLLASVVAIGLVLAGSWWIERQGGRGHWVLERRPDLVVWAYPHRLQIRNATGATTSVRWSAHMGLATGVVVKLPAESEQAAQALVASVAQHCPGITLGHSPEHLAHFKREPASLRSTSR